jgi:hypothetical protein
MGMFRDRGLVPVSPEIEFYLVKRNTDPDYPLEPPVGRSGRKETVRQPYSMDAVDEFEPFIQDIYDYCEVQRLHVDNLAHETGTAQLEINFQHGDAGAVRPDAFKRTIREAAMRHDLRDVHGKADGERAGQFHALAHQPGAGRDQCLRMPTVRKATFRSWRAAEVRARDHDLPGALRELLPALYPVHVGADQSRVGL